MKRKFLRNPAASILPILAGMFNQFMPAAAEYVGRSCTRHLERAGFTLDGGTKDVTLILQAAAGVHTPLSYVSVVRDKCFATRARDLGHHLDWSVLTETPAWAPAQK